MIEFFILQSVRGSEDDLTISEEFRRSEVSQCVWDRLKKKNPDLAFFLQNR